MVARLGFEPKTLWLKVKCSTDWANEPDGCLGWIRTSGMSESKSDALPLGYEAINKWWGDMDLNHGTRRNRFTVCRVWPLRYLPLSINVPICPWYAYNLIIKVMFCELLFWYFFAFFNKNSLFLEYYTIYQGIFRIFFGHEGYFWCLLSL